MATTTSVTSTATSAATTAVTSAATASQVSTGLSSVSSSISSAAAADSKGFSATISAWVNTVVEYARACLAKLPLIGSFFEKTTPATTTVGATTTSAVTTAYTDAQFVDMVKGVFVAAPTSTGVTAPAVPQADVIAYAMNAFGQIQAPAAKMEAFQAVLSAVNSTDDIARQFYVAFPVDVQDAFRLHIYLANGRSSVDAGGTDRGIGYGNHMVAHAIRSPVVQQAAVNHRAAMLAATTTTGTTSTI